ncbi:phosphotransferase enzyme family protein [Aspergillus campestris IBT 28561]|uniref:Phosphotransferase enzyme family protein n=1 Tax=Aspergillus campestris (strain IBT 28561) TaxID=1392248 RepID=A0A2I1D232_ASPC2|nr:phosphotransferase enzyme family protein [Aspergillus campestris IBT 28561]PKY03940.1 phosphotransferase enzyme family protein [Aspergillus campestris IBT 28561]
MAIRHVDFDMNELAKCAAMSIGLDPTQCVRVDKFPDGMFNKTFLLTMDNGAQVVGKVPNPNAGRAHFTTASEVATMDFVRNKLGAPVPKVLAWNSKASNSPVGAEYIIMEKVMGVPLESIWPKMDIKERFELVKTISGYQKSWMSASFPQYGSLYYSSDLVNCDECTLFEAGVDRSRVTAPGFSIGPSTGREFLDDGRIALEFDRGPWNSVEDYKSAIGYREIACVQNMSELPRSPVSLYGPGTYRPSRSRKIAALEGYLCLLKYLLPLDRSLSSSYLWHPDLHAENIFVNPERPSEVLGIIDWQSSELLPLFDQARVPYFLDFDGPISDSLSPPQLPADYDKLDPVEQDEAKSLYLTTSLFTLYRKFTLAKNKPLFNAMGFRRSTNFDMMLLAQNLLVDREALYISMILQLQDEWSCLPGVSSSGNPPFPIQFSADEAASIDEDASGAIKAMELMRQLKESLGDLWPEKGVVRPDQYNQTQERLEQAKTEFIDRVARSAAERAAWEDAWPFDK